MHSGQSWPRRAAVVALLGAVLLAGCSGSSSPDSGLISTTPESGSQSAEPDTDVKARFAEALRADTVNGETFQVDRDGTAIAGSVSYDSDRHEMSFSAAAPLDMMASYRASLSDAILTGEGQPIEPVAWNFRTRDGQWQDGDFLPKVVEPSFDREFGAHAYAPDGSLWVIWAQHDEGWAKVFTSHRSPAGWSEPHELAKVLFETFEISESRNLAPVVAMNSQGAGIAVWVDPNHELDMPRTDQLWAARWDGAAWSAPERIGISEGNTNPAKVSIDDAGNALVVWLHDFSEGSDDKAVVAQRYVAGVGWQSPQPLAGSEMAYHWAAHLERNGTALVSWGAREDAVIATARFSPSTGWVSTPPLNTTEAVRNVIARPRPDGSTVVAWTQPEGAFFDTLPLWFAVQRADGTWQTPVQLEADIESHDLSVGPSGEARLAYTTGADKMVLTRRLPADASEWLSTKQVASVDAGSVRLALDDKGRGVMVFEQRTDDGGRLWTSRLADPAGDAWSEPALTIDKPRTLRDLVGGPFGRAVLVMDTGDKVYADKRFE